MVAVVIFVGLFVIHVLRKLPEAASVDVTEVRMVDSVLQRNVFQVLLLLPLVVDDQVVGVEEHHAFGKRLTSKLGFLDAQPVHTCVTPLVPRLVVCGFPGLGDWAPLVQGHCFVTKLTVLSFDKIETACVS